MADYNEFSGEICVNVSEVFDIALESQAASTGYCWILMSMPSCLNLMDVSYQTSTSSLCGSKGQQVFRFVAVKEAKGCLEFGLARLNEPQKIVRKKSYVVVVQEKGAATVADKLRESLGAGRFVGTECDRGMGGPLPPYGVPMIVTEDKEKCMLMYGVPLGVAEDPKDCVLKYGVPVDFSHQGVMPVLRNLADNGIIVVYGVPTPEYGVPAITGAARQSGLCHERMTIIEDKDNCVIKYGIPGGIPENSGKCVLKYGAPVILKYGVPAGGQCVVKYGTPDGGMGTGENCVLKYGFPLQVEESKDNCILKYGTPSGIGSGEGCVLKYGAPVKLQDTKTGKTHGGAEE